MPKNRLLRRFAVALEAISSRWQSCWGQQWQGWGSYCHSKVSECLVNIQDISSFTLESSRVHPPSALQAQLFWSSLRLQHCGTPLQHQATIKHTVCDAIAPTESVGHRLKIALPDNICKLALAPLFVSLQNCLPWSTGADWPGIIKIQSAWHTCPEFMYYNHEKQFTNGVDFCLAPLAPAGADFCLAPLVPAGAGEFCLAPSAPVGAGKFWRFFFLVCGSSRSDLSLSEADTLYCDLSDTHREASSLQI